MFSNSTNRPSWVNLMAPASSDIPQDRQPGLCPWLYPFVPRRGIDPLTSGLKTRRVCHSTDAARLFWYPFPVLLDLDQQVIWIDVLGSAFAALDLCLVAQPAGTFDTVPVLELLCSD